VDVLIAKGDFVTVDLSDTQIFRTVWTRFGWQSNADKKLFLVLTSADSNGYEEWVKKM
jgi:ATP phosphoribosyltransferase regulatory subunit HisZ